MSDQIGGGSGGSGGMGGLMSGLMSMIDPAGLLSGLMGGIQGATNGGDMSSIAQAGQSLLGQLGQGTNIMSLLGGGDTKASTAEGQTPASTEYPQDQSATPPPGYSAQAQTGEPAVDPEVMKTVQVLAAHYSSFDEQGARSGFGDGKFNRDNLLSIANDSYWDTSPDIKNAAKYLLEHPDLFNQLAIISGTGDGCVSTQAVGQYLSKLIEQASGSSSSCPPASSSVTTSTGSSSAPTQSQHASSEQTGEAAPAGETYKPPPPKHFDAEEGAFGLPALHGNVEDLMSQLEKANNAAANGEPGAAAEAQRLSQKLQLAMNLYQQMNTLYSNLMSAFHSVQMSTINNIRG